MFGVARVGCTWVGIAGGIGSDMVDVARYRRV
jgi:hypothetical protein